MVSEQIHPSFEEGGTKARSTASEDARAFARKLGAIGFSGKHTTFGCEPANREQHIREAVLLSFCDPLPGQCSRLWRVSSGEWQRVLRWLDTSGLALFFLDRLAELQWTDMLPDEVLARLQQNVADNTERMHALMADAIWIHEEFRQAGLSYALLKGFSLWPHSVPRLELRSQLDLDFLVAEKDIEAARIILEKRGYRLHAISGRSWEFKTEHMPGGSLNDLYKNLPFRSVELHTEAGVSDQVSLLASAETRSLNGVALPVLASVDLFLGQGLHLYKHICGEFFRVAHLIEFRRHVLARRWDEDFWIEVRSRAERSSHAWLGLGVVTLLITRTMGEFAPPAFTSWTVERLPATVRLWVDIYGRRSVLASHAGSKLYLLLQRETEIAGIPGKRPLHRALIPLNLPPPVMYSPANESLRDRFSRYRFEIRFILLRLRFHLVEGLRFCWESMRWRRLTAPLR